ncbi:hypothetical protein GALL_412350 [mine drainage metagenome]|uniref:Uncharacterized protein n=1 Tax=mine drainage metagenome TaxID=410659 RepID=A0A1J5Q068_9ZZZZ
MDGLALVQTIQTRDGAGRLAKARTDCREAVARADAVNGVTAHDGMIQCLRLRLRLRLHLRR